MPLKKLRYAQVVKERNGNNIIRVTQKNNIWGSVKSSAERI